MTRKEIIKEIEQKLPSLQSKFLSLVEKEKRDVYRKIIIEPFDGYNLENGSEPLGWWYRDGPDNSRFINLSNQPSIKFMKEVIKMYSSIFYTKQLGHQVVGESPDLKNMDGKTIRLVAWGKDTWKSYYIYYQIDKRLETQYLMLVKIKNRWHEIKFSSQFAPSIKEKSLKPNFFND